MHRTASLAALAALALAPLSAAAGFYTKSSGVMEIMGKDFDKLIRNSANSSIVEFYAPWCGHCQNLKPAYISAAKSLEGLANVAAVNCDEEDNKAFCGSMRVQGFPTLKTVKVTGTIGKPIIQDYSGPRTAADIVEATKNLIPNYVDRVELKGFDGWLQKKNESAKAILFSNKGATSALIKSIANDYRGNMAIAQVRDKEKEINALFGVTTFPTLVVLPGGNEPAVTFEGEMKKPAMSRFLNQYAELRVDSDKKSNENKSKSKNTKSSGKSSSSDSSKFAEASASHASAEGSSSAAASAQTITLEEPGPSESPGPIVNEEAPTPVPVPDVPPPLPSFETLADLQSKCLGADTHTCLLALLPPNANPEAEPPQKITATLGSLAELAQKHKLRGDHLFPFYSVPASNVGVETLSTFLDLPETDDPILVAVNGKRKWYRKYDSDTKGFSSSALEDWVDGIRMGEGQKHKLPEELLAISGGEERSASEPGEAQPHNEKPVETSSTVGNNAKDPTETETEEAKTSAEEVSESTTTTATVEKVTSTIVHEDL